MPERDPRFFTIHIPTTLSKAKEAYPARPPQEISIRVNAPEKPPAIIGGMGEPCALRPAIAAVEKNNTPLNAKAAIQVEDNVQKKTITKVEAKDIIPKQEDQEGTVPESNCRSGSLHKIDAGFRDLKLPPPQRELGGIISCTTETTNHPQLAGASSNSQQPQQMSEKEQAPISSSTPQRKQAPGKRTVKTISETMSKETSHSRLSKPEKLYPLSNRHSETLSLRSILSRQHRYSLDSAAATKAATTSSSILPDYNKLRNNDLHSRHRRKSVSFGSRSTNLSSHSTNQQQEQQQQQQKSMSTRTLYDSRPKTIFTRNSRLRPKATWLDVTGTPEAWIQPTRLSKEPHHTDDANQIVPKKRLSLS